MINVSNVSKTFYVKKQSKKALSDINIKIPNGKIVGLLGVNGAGKSTLIKILGTLLNSDSGEIFYDGLNIKNESKLIRNKINIITGGERSLYWRLTGRENLTYFASLYKIKKIERNSRINNLIELLDLKEFIDTSVERYSKGQKQRLQIARGLINNPDYLFLDEPTLGLDIDIAKEIRKYIKKIVINENKGVILTTHYIKEVEELCDYIYVLDKGKIILEGDIESIKKNVNNTKKICIELKEITEENIITLKKVYPIIEVNEKIKKIFIHIEENDNNYVSNISKIFSEIIGISVKEENLEDLLLNLIRANHD